jgi:hypothetical protein
MSNAITPSKQELAAYDEVNEAIYNPTQPTISGERYRRAAIIATHTRYDGQDASWWCAEAEKQRLRAEAAEARVRTAQAEALRWAASVCKNPPTSGWLRIEAAAILRGEVTLP